MAQETWTMALIKTGIEKLMADLGRMPTTTEIDDSSELPSARQIQRRFGGIPAIRKELGYEDILLDRGSFRSDSAKFTGIRGLALEHQLYGPLVDRFGEIFVHRQKPTGQGRQALDFYVYATGTAFGIDVFYANGLNSLKTNIRQKVSNYVDYSGKLYLVYDSPVSIGRVDGRVCILSLREFLDEVQSYQPYQISSAY